MTVALGIRCMDGMVLCADSLESDGVTKRMVRKLWRYEVQDQGVNEWGIAIASAGEADLADSFNDELKDVLGNCDFDEDALLSKLKSVLRNVRINYPEAHFGFIATVYGNPKLYKKVLRVMDGSSHLGPVSGYQAIGLGGGLANFLASKLYTPSMCVDEASRLAIFIVSQVKEHCDGCGGPTAVITYGGSSSNPFQFRDWGRDEISSIEAEVSDQKFREALIAFWNKNNPPATFPRASIPEGGVSRWTINTKLNTIP